MQRDQQLQYFATLPVNILILIQHFSGKKARVKLLSDQYLEIIIVFDNFIVLMFNSRWKDRLKLIQDTRQEVIIDEK